MKRKILQVTGLAAIAALLCAGCGGGDDDKNRDASNFVGWMNGYKLEHTVNGGGALEISPERDYYKGGDTVKITARARNSYKLRSWEGAASGNDTAITLEIPYGSQTTVTLTANFERYTQYAVTFDVNGVEAEEPGPLTVPRASPVNFSRKEGDRYVYNINVFTSDGGAKEIKFPKLDGVEGNVRFDYWAESPDGKGVRYSAGESYDVGENITFYAQWKYKSTVTFDRNGGTGTGPEPIELFPDSLITLPGKDNLGLSGHEFNGWSEDRDGSETPPYEEGDPYVVTGDLTLYAQWVDNSVDIGDAVEGLMVEVAGGTFSMGESGNSVEVGGFFISRHEVTQKLWKRVMGNNPSEFKGDDLPVQNVSWEDAQEFIEALNAETGGKYRLPTEAEWEFAARGGNDGGGYLYSGGNTPGGVAVHKTGSPEDVGGKSANELGLYDMSGNVWEWVDNDADGPCYCDPDYGDVLVNVLRGGGYGDNEVHCTVFRGKYKGIGYRDNDVGFRLARDP